MSPGSPGLSRVPGGLESPHGQKASPQQETEWGQHGGPQVVAELAEGPSRDRTSSTRSMSICGSHRWPPGTLRPGQQFLPVPRELPKAQSLENHLKHRDKVTVSPEQSLLFAFLLEKTVFIILKEIERERPREAFHPLVLRRWPHWRMLGQAEAGSQQLQLRLLPQSRDQALGRLQLLFQAR